MTLEDFNIDGRQAVVIGAGRGIGRGIALAFAEAGVDVAVVALNAMRIEEVANRAQAMGVLATGYSTNAVDADAMDALGAQVLHDFPNLSIVVNCVGDSIRKQIADAPGEPGSGMTSADWHRIIDLNLSSAFEGCRVFGPHLRARGAGSVINVSGVRGMRASKNMAAYASSKAGIARLTEAAALEWGPDIRVNAISPGLFPDPEQESPEDIASYTEQVKPRIPLQRIGGVREVGLMAVYLASDAASYVTGQTFVIDGGTSLV
ncbi:MAG: SDR family oxidoreductase [Chloroflexi bacterium]|nr:SDR family oxidoreductase [Chloroflexota bacterium]MDA1174943.1 SDR family oxidoreductase [Chloroflexota bacterium]